jgi:hypothetical protein
LAFFQAERAVAELEGSAAEDTGQEPAAPSLLTLEYAYTGKSRHAVSLRLQRPTVVAEVRETGRNKNR